MFLMIFGKFDQFTKRPATYSYNKRGKYQPHVIPTCFNTMDNKRKSMNYRQLIKSHTREVWLREMYKELGKFSNGYKYLTEGTNTVEVMTRYEVNYILKDKTITYTRITADYRDQKEDSYRIMITVGEI